MPTPGSHRGLTPSSSFQTFITARSNDSFATAPGIDTPSIYSHDLPQPGDLDDVEVDVDVKGLADVDESQIDPRLELANSARPTEEELDESLVTTLSRTVSRLSSTTTNKSRGKDIGAGDAAEKQAGERRGMEEEPLYIEFKPGDTRNPINYSRRKKWAITCIACSSSFLSSITVSSYNMGFSSMTRDLNATIFQATIGLSLFTLGFGVVPMITAAFSEEFGRRPLYIVSMVGFAVMYVMVAEANNIHTVQIARFLQGAFGSTGATMVGGTIADIWAPEERGLPMSLFTLVAVGANGFGPVFSGWIELNQKLEWKWIQWVQLMICGAVLVVIPFMGETRSSIILAKMARILRKKTGNKRYRARAEDERGSMRRLVWISCTRPLYLLATEPIVGSFSLWIGFAWGVLFVMVESIGSVFQDLHGFNIGQVGTVFLTVVIGCFLGFFANLYQERLYRKHFPSRGIEARLYLACAAGVLFPVGMMIYAWACFPHVHWMGLAVGITVFIWSTYVIYLSVFSYLADCYGPFASSALAGQSLARNLGGTIFPLFTHQMYTALSYKWANFLFACVAILLMPIPYVLFFYGPKIRQRSKFSRKVTEG
ncbi:MFS polyamine transporter [Ephemerocybe angulata]|uniref:MFS polyamine transporter n=1 Tax=Ephemerocybe angulata TaxID=980116 RepID=A0A8H6HWK7_9AGAR|nr:MFS polyamine transporter [Tulosesus angulatus]